MALASIMSDSYLNILNYRDRGGGWTDSRMLPRRHLGNIGRVLVVGCGVGGGVLVVVESDF